MPLGELSKEFHFCFVFRFLLCFSRHREDVSYTEWKVFAYDIILDSFILHGKNISRFALVAHRGNLCMKIDWP